MKIVFWFTMILCIPFFTFANAASKNELKVKSRDQAIQLVKREYPGKILKVQSNKINENTSYQIKLISDKGIVFSLSVDAKTGGIKSK